MRKRTHGPIDDLGHVFGRGEAEQEGGSCRTEDTEHDAGQQQVVGSRTMTMIGEQDQADGNRSGKGEAPDTQAAPLLRNPYEESQRDSQGSPAGNPQGIGFHQWVLEQPLQDAARHGEHPADTERSQAPRQTELAQNGPFHAARIGFPPLPRPDRHLANGKRQQQAKQKQKDTAS